MTKNTHTLALVGDPRDVAVARTFAQRFLDAEGLDGEAQDVLLVVSELVTNAIVHGAPPITVALRFEPPNVAVAVTDAGDSDPSRRHPVDDDEHGRGLHIVESLSAEWRVDHAEKTKTIVAVVPALTQIPRQR